MSGGSLYALLEQEAKDYLRHGPSTDAELEQLGVNFARVCVAVCLSSFERQQKE